MPHKLLHIEVLERRLLLTAEFVDLRTFGLVEYIPVVSAGAATAAVLGDFNKDGAQDLAFGSSQRRGLLDERNSVVGVALGDQESVFRIGTEQEVHDDVVALVAADLNGDGYDDLVAGGIFRMTVLLSQVSELGDWQGLGEPTYLGGTAETIVVEDLNGDGFLDIASTATEQWLDNPQGDPPDPSFANRDFTHVYIYTGDGEGGFTESARYEGTTFLLGVDYDDDGDVDLLTRHISRDETFGPVLLNESDGNGISFRVGESLIWDDMQTHVEYPTYDVNGDGIPDKLGTNVGYDWGNFYSIDETFYQLGKADGSFESALHLAPLYYRNWREWGLGVSLPSGADPYVYDVDGNGENDFVHIRGNSIHLVKQGLLEGYSTVASNYSSSSNRLYHSRFFDINGDGFLDYVANEGEYPVVRHFVQEGKPDGSFGESYFLTKEEFQALFEEQGIVAYCCSSGVVRVDVNGDGLVDQVEQTRYDHNVWRVSLIDSSGNLTPIQEVELSSFNRRLVGIDDIDGDSHLDLLVVQTNPDTSVDERVALKGDGTGHFLPPESYVAPHMPLTYHKNGGVGVATLEPSSTAEYWSLPRIASFQLPIPNQSGVQPGSGGPNHAAQHVDVDGDGDLDVVVGHGSGVAVVFAVGKGDFDEDGKLTMADFAILAANFGRENTPPEQGDINLDGNVDFQDFLAFARIFKPL